MGGKTLTVFKRVKTECRGGSITARNIERKNKRKENFERRGGVEARRRALKGKKSSIQRCQKEEKTGSMKCPRENRREGCEE